jgi:hypothetical protein
MTSETRTTIEFKDIAGMEIECPECKLAIFYPVAKLCKIQTNCPHCNAEWFDQTGDARPATYPAIDNMQQIAEQLRKLTRDDRTDIHAKVRLRINADLPEA